MIFQFRKFWLAVARCYGNRRSSREGVVLPRGSHVIAVADADSIVQRGVENPKKILKIIWKLSLVRKTVSYHWGCVSYLPDSLKLPKLSKRCLSGTTISRWGSRWSTLLPGETCFKPIWGCQIVSRGWLYLESCLFHLYLENPRVLYRYRLITSTVA